MSESEVADTCKRSFFEDTLNSPIDLRKKKKKYTRYRSRTSAVDNEIAGLISRLHITSTHGDISSKKISYTSARPRSSSESRISPFEDHEKTSE